MHVEDYIHRIGRTGRANAIGDAISFVTPEDHGELRALERFIGRGIVRKRAEGFNYSATPPPGAPMEDERRQRGQQGRNQPRGQSGPPRHAQGSSSQPRSAQGGRPQHGGGRSQPQSGNREGGNQGRFNSRPPSQSGFGRSFGSR